MMHVQKRVARSTCHCHWLSVHIMWSTSNLAGSAQRSQRASFSVFALLLHSARHSTCAASHSLPKSLLEPCLGTHA